MNELLGRLERWLRKNCPDCYQSLLPGVAREEFEAFEDALVVQMPEALKELYRWRNGQAPKSRPIFGNAHARYTFMTLREAQEAHANLGDILQELEDEGSSGRDTWWHPGWVPFLDGCGDYLCVDTKGTLGGSPGQVLSFFHDDSSRVIESPGLRNWLETFVVSLEADMWQGSRDGLELLDKDGFEQLARRMNAGYPVVVHSQV
jgi:cell wall assembly regulator SMI1